MNADFLALIFFVDAWRIKMRCYILWIKWIDDQRCSLLTRLVSLRQLCFYLFCEHFFFFWVSRFIYCVNVFIWALRMTFLAHIWLLGTKECIHHRVIRRFTISHYQRMHSIMALMERLIIAQCQKNRVQLSSPVTTNKR